MSLTLYHVAAFFPNLPLFEIAFVLLRLDYVACIIVNADHRIM